MTETISTTAEGARRLAVTKQHLAGRVPRRANREDILTAIRDLAYVQWDPINIVAPSHVLSLWARIGDFELADLDSLMWDEKKVFEHWTPVASIVLTEDYPLYRSLMSRYPESLSGSWRSQAVKAKRFLTDHRDLRKAMLRELEDGPLQIGQFKDHLRTKRAPETWAPESDVSEMLYHLTMTGEVMVVGHRGNQNVWGLSEEFLPGWLDKERFTVEDFERAAAQRAIRALGTASPSEINYYFVRGRYQNLKKTLAGLEEESAIKRAEVDGFGKRDERYIHGEDVSLLESLEGDAWRPRMSLLPPFDNLICSQARTNKVFGFDYVREQFLPKEMRKYGTYVLPLLWGDRLIGRVDLHMDRQKRILFANSVHAEQDAPEDTATASEISETIDGLAEFLGAKKVQYTGPVPPPWSGSLR